MAELAAPSPPTGASRAAGVVLAAGSSRRMGRPKQLLPVEGRPLLGVVVDAACASRLDVVVVVLGAHAATVAERVPLGRARAVVNDDHETGLSSSLRAGIAALGDDIGRAVVLLGDQPGIDAALIDRLLEVHEASGLPAAALSFDGLLHPPVVLGRVLWEGLGELEGDEGCRRILRTSPELVAALPAAAPGRHPVDIDTPEDYGRLVAAVAPTAPAAGPGEGPRRRLDAPGR